MPHGMQCRGPCIAKISKLVQTYIRSQYCNTDERSTKGCFSTLFSNSIQTMVVAYSKRSICNTNNTLRLTANEFSLTLSLRYSFNGNFSLIRKLCKIEKKKANEEWRKKKSLEENMNFIWCFKMFMSNSYFGPSKRW